MTANLTIVVDLMWGSCGKGKLVSELANKNQFDACVSTNMPNAGHTVHINGEPVVYKVLCSASHLTPLSLVAPSAVFSLDRLWRESRLASEVVIHENARIIQQGDQEEERSDSILSGLASTAQGSTLPMIRRLRRDPVGRVAGVDLPTNTRVVTTGEWLSLLDGRILCEVAQGYGLSVDWGDFPYTTSRNCTPADMVAAMGLPVTTPCTIVGIIRPYPIRVGNALGYSGPMGDEISWDVVASEAGIIDADKLAEAEHTTVTKRTRRVARIDWGRVRAASIACGCHQIFVNFAQYIDNKILGVEEEKHLSKKIHDFISTVEDVCRAPVCGVGTSATTTVWMGI